MDKWSPKAAATTSIAILRGSSTGKFPSGATATSRLALEFAAKHPIDTSLSDGQNPQNQYFQDSTREFPVRLSQAILSSLLFVSCTQDLTLDAGLSSVELGGQHLNGQNVNGQHLNGQHLNGQHLNGQHLNG